MSYMRAYSFVSKTKTMEPEVNAHFASILDSFEILDIEKKSQ